MVWGILILAIIGVGGLFIAISLLRRELSQQLTQQFSMTRNEMQQGLSSSSSVLENRVKELESRFQNKLEQNLKEGFLHFDKVQQQLFKTESQLIQLQSMGKSIEGLNQLLKLPHLRGGFGEALLEQILADFLPQSSYELQYTIVANSKERVDAIIRYPNAVLPIDSKFPREQILPLFESNDPLQLETARTQLITVIRKLAKDIKEKYIRPEHGTTEMALLFIPSETIYFEILKNPKIFEELNKQKVFAVSPNTLAITLHAISVSKNYYDMAKGIEKTIQEVKKAKQHFENFERRFEEVGSALEKSQSAYQMAVTHLSRFEGASERLLGSHAETEVPTPPSLSQ